jgi:hypothetical protein
MEAIRLYSEDFFYRFCQAVFRNSHQHFRLLNLSKSPFNLRGYLKKMFCKILVTYIKKVDIMA